MKITISELRNLIKKQVIRLFEQAEVQDAESNEDLVKRFQDGDTSALEDLVKNNVGLVHYVIKKLGDLGISREDLVQSGVEGILKAAQKFDPEAGASFASYARNWIKANVLNQAKLARPVWIGGRDERKALNSYKSAKRKLKKELGRVPTDQEIADELGIDVSTIEKVRGVSSTSIDQPVGGEEDEDMTLGSILPAEGPSPEESAESAMLADLFDQFESTLSEKEALIWSALKPDGPSVKEVADELGVSRQAVDWHLKKLRGRFQNFYKRSGTEMDTPAFT